MLNRVPDYYTDFRCLAQDCPHTCCAGWEVVIDEETAEQYQRLTGALGEKLRASMKKDVDGDFCFPLNGGRCPFLDAENLCEIHRQLGEEATSVTCQEHPRFIEEYGSFREITLSASCPAANALLLGSEEPLTFLEFETEEAEEEGDEWLPYLLVLRDRVMELLTNRRYSIETRLHSILKLAREAQTLLDEEWVEDLPELAEQWTICETEERLGAELFPQGLSFLQTLEQLEPDWEMLLIAAQTVEEADVPEPLLERIAAYFMFRYLLKTVNDGDVLSRVEWCVVAVLIIRRLAGVCGLSEALRRFSREVEHNEENVDALLEALRLHQLSV